jgi:hypothetical protein
VLVDSKALSDRGYVPVTGDYLTKGDLARHDSANLARSIRGFVAGGSVEPGRRIEPAIGER